MAMGSGKLKRKHSWRRVAAALALGALFTTIVAFFRGTDPRFTRNNVGVRSSDEKVCDRDAYPQPSDLGLNRVTVLINGYSEARIPLLEKQTRVFSGSQLVHSVYILWGNTSTADEVLQACDFDSLGAPIHVVKQSSSSLNNRFLPRAYIKTRAVIICDDDISIDTGSLEFAFRVWQENQERIVGFFPRSHFYQLSTKSWIYTKQLNRYSIILTKFMVLATEFLYLYTCEMPAGVKEYVDERLNCEDIAMNFVVSSFSSQSSLLVEGNLRDLGDSRNSDAGQLSSGLSSRSGHRKDRGECIAAFHRLWERMPLKSSSFKAAADLREPALCDKFGLVIDCDASIVSRRDGLRYLGTNVVTSTTRYAYVTMLSSKEDLSSAVALVESLKSTETIHDIVLLADGSTDEEEDFLEQHFDVVKHSESSLQSLWLLQEYSKVVFIAATSIVLSNLDHLFQAPEIAAAPDYRWPGRFDTRLFVAEPSKATYTKMLERRNISEALFLNDFFDDWYYLPWHHRLASTYGVPVDIGNEPLGYDRESTYRRIGTPLVLHGTNGSLSGYKPTSSGVVQPQPQLLKTRLRPVQRKAEALVTVLWSENQAPCLDVFLSSYYNTHHQQSGRDKLLLLLSSVSRPPNANKFESVVLVHPILAGDAGPSFAMLHLWNQTQYSKLLYIDACSIFLRNSDLFFDYDGPLAAAASRLPADSFSSGLMLVEPSRGTFDRLSSTVVRQGKQVEEDGVEVLLNDVFAKAWYRSSAASQRIPSWLVYDGRYGVAVAAREEEHKLKVMVFSPVIPTWSSLSKWGSAELERVEKARLQQYKFQLTRQ